MTMGHVYLIMLVIFLFALIFERIYFARKFNKQMDKMVEKVRLLEGNAAADYVKSKISKMTYF